MEIVLLLLVRLPTTARTPTLAPLIWSETCAPEAIVIEPLIVAVPEVELHEIFCAAPRVKVTAETSSVVPEGRVMLGVLSIEPPAPSVNVPAPKVVLPL